MNYSNKKTGTVLLVGAGPGDPGLLTVKGQEAIARADCIIYDRLASPKLLLAAKEGCELIYVGKADHRHVLPQDDINALLVEKANEYDNVVRLKGGDSYVFGRGGEEGMYLASHGIDFGVIPGVTSAIAGPAAAGIPVTHRGTATGFSVVTAHGRDDRLTDIDFSRLTDEKETCIFLMGLRHVREVADNLVKAGRRPDTPAAVISHATTEEQRTCTGTLEDIAGKVEAAGLTSPSIIVVGDVVSLRGKLSAAAGSRTDGCSRDAKQMTAREEVVCGTADLAPTYIVPVIRSLGTPHTSLAELLRETGARVTEIPVGEIRLLPLNLPEEASTRMMQQQNRHRMPDWLIFTSQNAVEGFFAGLREQCIDMRALGCTRIAAVGSKTAARLGQYGVFADLVPDEESGDCAQPQSPTPASQDRAMPKTPATAAALAHALSAVAGREDSIWYIRGEVCGDAVAQAFAGYPNYRELIVYRNERVALSPGELQDMRTLIAAADGIFFTSASSVLRIADITRELPDAIFSIGPACTKQLHKLGYTGIREAAQTSYEGLAALTRD